MYVYIYICVCALRMYVFVCACVCVFMYISITALQSTVRARAHAHVRTPPHTHIYNMSCDDGMCDMTHTHMTHTHSDMTHTHSDMTHSLHGNRHACDMTYLYTLHTSFIYMTCLIQYTWHDSVTVETAVGIKPNCWYTRQLKITSSIIHSRRRSDFKCLNLQIWTVFPVLSFE